MNVAGHDRRPLQGEHEPVGAFRDEQRIIAGQYSFLLARVIQDSMKDYYPGLIETIAVGDISRECLH